MGACMCICQYILLTLKHCDGSVEALHHVVAADVVDERVERVVGKGELLGHARKRVVAAEGGQLGAQCAERACERSRSPPSH